MLRKALLTLAGSLMLGTAVVTPNAAHAQLPGDPPPTPGLDSPPPGLGAGGPPTAAVL